MGSPNFLEIRSLTKSFGGLFAVNDLNLTIHQGEIMGLIGPNGAGKSTVLNVISGTTLPSRGELFFKGKNVTGSPPYRISKQGISRVFQGNLLFKRLPVMKNVLVGTHLRTKWGFFSSVLGLPYSRRLEKAMHDKAEGLLRLVGMLNQADVQAMNLSHGNQRLLCLAVALAGDPEVLLLDEPVTGMNNEEVSAMVSIIKRLKQEKGITTIVVEHNMRAVMDLCDRITVISYGSKIAQGTPQEIVKNPVVIEAYLGVDHDFASN